MAQASSALLRARRAAFRLPPGPRALSLAALIGAWALAAWAAADPMTLPGPLAVLWEAGAETLRGALPVHLVATLLRVAAAFALALAVGAAVGVAMGRSRRTDAFLDLWLIAFLNLPALVVIALCYIWIGLNETAAVLAVAINKIPLVATMMREGARALDPALDDMARAFAMPWGDRLRHVVLPQLAPHLASAARAGLSLVWKIVLVVEFLGRPNGVGFMIHLNFQSFDVAGVLAYALAFVGVMLAAEAFLMRPWERRANRWRTA